MADLRVFPNDLDPSELKVLLPDRHPKRGQDAYKEPCWDENVGYQNLTYTKAVGLETMSLLILLPFFRGEEADRGVNARAPQRNREGEGVGIMASRS